MANVLKRSSKSQPATSEKSSAFADTHGIITTTTNDVAGYRTVKTLGTVYGIVVQSRNWGADIGGLLKSSVGGELTVFTKMMYTARNTASDRMIGECMGKGGNAVLGVRFDIATENPWAQVCAYGTAVVIEPLEDENRDKVRSDEKA
jgi:uncharacterized protein YbjQ (UPF0145 family)